MGGDVVQLRAHRTGLGAARADLAQATMLLTLWDRSPKPTVALILGGAIRMEGPEDLAATVQRLEARVHSLEALYGLIDLLALPGLLSGGAARIFDSTQAADTIPAQALGFYGKEVDGRGLPLRWTRFPEPGVLDIAVLAGMPFLLRLKVLHTPHIRGPGDLDISLAGGEALPFEEAGDPENGVVEFSARINPENTGLVRLYLSSKTPLKTASADTRKLGLPFVQLRSSPYLPITLAD